MAAPVFLEESKEERIAIVGGGPGGLNAAYHLGRRGYSVTIFEALPVSGGMLAVGIPEYRLPKDVLEQDIRFICQHRVDIQTNKKLGKDFRIDDLFQEGYKAVLLAMGAHWGQKMNVPGEDAPGVLAGIDFLRKVSLAEKVEVGKKVASSAGGRGYRYGLHRSADGGERVFIIYRRTG
jgi:NADPH-dependent glutamate synthase beta subunit-like oxidoreductase